MRLSHLLAGLVLVVASAGVALAETVELVTYYPATFSGEADRFHARRATIGDDYSLTTPAVLDEGTLLVGDRIGVGVDAPAGPLHVVGRNNTEESVLFQPGTGAGASLTVRFDTARTIFNAFDGVPLHWMKTAGAEPASVFIGLEGTANGTAQAVWIAPRGVPGLVVREPGNVGVGIQNPLEKLHVSGGFLRLDGPRTIINGFDAPTRIHWIRTAGTGPLDEPNTVFLGFKGTAGGAAEEVQIAPRGVLGVVVKDTGNVGIGIADPTTPLEMTGPFKVVLGPGNRNHQIQIGTTTPSGAPAIGFWANLRPGGSNLAANSLTQRGAVIAVDGGNTGGRMMFTAAPNAAQGTTWQPQSDTISLMTLLLDSGNVGIGTTTPGAYKLNVNGSVFATGGFTPSDARLKTDVTPLTGVLPKLDRLQAVSFRWKDSARSEGLNLPHGPQIGVIAQEVEQVFPELIGGETDHKAVDYGRFTAVLLEAVKELKAENKRMKDEIKELRKKVDAR